MNLETEKDAVFQNPQKSVDIFTSITL